MSGVIIIKNDQKATYVVNKDFNYYLQAGPGSTITFKSKSGGAININKNLWGPGNLVFSCSVNINASIGVAPTQAEITGLPCYNYSTSEFTEEIQKKKKKKEH